MTVGDVEVRLRGQTYPCTSSETLLEALERHGIDVPYSCRRGVCLSCMLRAVAGKVPANTQASLKEALRIQRYFLSCICHPTEALEVALPEDCGFYRSATVKSLERLTPKMARLRLRPETPIDYRPGQFVTLRRSDGLARPYSLASHPTLDDHLELHVQRMPQGLMSNWIFEFLEPEMRLQVSESNGTCFYVPGRATQDLLMIGTGSGLAPLIGIVRDALARGHSGKLMLYHGSHSPDGLYLSERLREVTEAHANFAYIPCVSGPTVPDGCRSGRADDVAFAEHPDLDGRRVMLSGNPAAVRAAKKRAYLSGASLAEIHAEAFELRDPQT